jgi:hypothetical protein
MDANCIAPCPVVGFNACDVEPIFGYATTAFMNEHKLLEKE